MKNLIAQGIARKLIRLEDNDKYIVYVDQNKRRNFDNPEEKVQAEAYLSLVLDYKYPAGQVRQFVGIQMGAETKEADIIVYEDAMRLKPLIVVECKKQDVTELEFQRAVDQAFSYAVVGADRKLTHWGCRQLTQDCILIWHKGRKALKDEAADKIEANDVRFDLKDWSAIRFDEPNALRKSLAQALVAHYLPR